MAGWWLFWSTLNTIQFIGGWFIMGIQFFTDHYQWDIAWFQKLRVTLPCGESSDSLFAGDIPDFWCMEKKRFLVKRDLFFSTFCKYNPDVFPEFRYFLTFQKHFKELTVESWYFQMSWPSTQLIFCHSFQVFLQDLGPMGRWKSPLQLMANQLLNSLNIYNFFCWFIAIMYSYSNLKCLQHSISNY